MAYETVLVKLHQLGFSKSSLMWIASYWTGRSHFVQIDDHASKHIGVTSGVPQGSILGLVLFNLYINNLSEVLPPKVNSHQYDDTTIYKHCKPTEIEKGKLEMQSALDKLSSWSLQCHLALNPKKTKAMLFQPPKCHGCMVLISLVPRRFFCKENIILN